ncbi:MAG: hypothetical protein WC444_01975 [Candidatus Paceibacterota bacterium]
MKRHLKRYTSLAYYIDFLRRQPKHMQHVYAFIFSGSITVLIAGIILYTDYGFWHDRYVRDDSALVVQSTSTPSNMESPGEALSSFWNEAYDQFHSIGKSSGSLLEGKETYIK